jgi:ribulose-5-phosphate 4-epimerase/fuculose-1-phosphate aldolase
LELVLLARTLVPEGYDDHLAGHITIRQPDGTFLCNPWFLPWDEFLPSDVIRIDIEGNVLEGEWPAPLGIPLHLEFHKLRHNVGVALHHHSHWGGVWADAGRIPPHPDQSGLLGGGSLVLVDEYGGGVSDVSAAAAAAAAIGDADMALLANHGVFVTGATVRAVHQRAVALEHRCRMAWHAEQIGGVKLLPEHILKQFEQSDGNRFVGFWEAMVRRALRAEPALLDFFPS